jgi:hypothetical protein
MLTVFHFDKLATAIFRVNELGKGFGRSYTAPALGTVLKVKPELPKPFPKSLTLKMATEKFAKTMENHQ